MHQRVFWAAACMSLLVSGCASLRNTQRLDEPMPFSFAGRLENGPLVPAPTGLVAFCAREPMQCQTAGTSARLVSASFTGAPPLRASNYEVWRALINRPAPAPQSHSGAMKLTPQRWRELQIVNRQINAAIRPAADQVRYGVAEFWTMPISVEHDRAPSGDCEDYALEKRERLIELGWPAESLSLAVAMSPDVGRHAVLVASTSLGDFVLDNLFAAPRAVSTLQYQWLSRQAGPDVLEWAVARAVSIPAPVPGLYQAESNSFMLASLATAQQP